MSGGWAAKELCEKGYETLVLERGRDLKHGEYPTAMKESWEMPNRGGLTPQFREANPILTGCGAVNGTNEHLFAKDADHPYEQKKPFSWIKGYQVGGKSHMWARLCQRWSDLDFEANAKDGHGVDWPIRYRDIAPWYSYVEKFVGVAGNRDGLSQVPDGEFLPAMGLHCLDRHVKEVVESNYPGRHLIASRTANATVAHQGRGPCQMRNRCNRGCPFGGYYSSVVGSLPAAAATGRMTLRPDSVVHSLIYDDKSGKAVGVRVIDAHTKEMTEYYSRIIFLNAGTMNTTSIMLNSVSSRFENGFGNDSDTLGRYLMDHNFRAVIQGEYHGLQDSYYYGKRPTGAYMPRFRNFGDDKQEDFLRGYAFGFYSARQRGGFDETPPIGAAFKENQSKLGKWTVWVSGMGEQLPYADNRITLSKDEVDEWGMPLMEVDMEYKENETTMTKDMLATGADMLEKAGFVNIRARNSGENPGLGIHEMGTARMGRNPKTSVLNAFNQVHAAPNVFVSDGACMTSNACQNPSITYMALTARAANHAAEELRKGNL
ncbi:hypothetical protein VDG1235_4635 [Verrucomicrobiia bacterium DG1235]|nr:hypothetical protein VDG1235_4635 [Verrucomicrobiae bacterium DG1235]